jgi:hypothetical protein
MTYSLSPLATGKRMKQGSVFRDEKGELRLQQSECSHIIRPLALNVLRMAQYLVSGQGSLEIGGERHTAWGADRAAGGQVAGAFGGRSPSG